MAGLLDSLFNDPGTRGLLGMLAAAGPTQAPQSFGQRLFGAIAQEQAMRSQEEEKRARMGLLGAQLEETKAQAAERQANAAKQQQAAARMLEFRQALGGLSPQQALAAGGGPTPGNAAQIGAVDWDSLSKRFPEQVELIQKLASAKNFGRDPVARVLETLGPNGTVLQRRETQYGDPVGADLQKPVEMKIEDLGGVKQAYNPFSLIPGLQLPKTQTPDGAANNAVALANLALSRQRFAHDQAQADKGQYDAERGLLVNPRTGVATPVTQGGAPIGAKDKGLNDAQAKALLFASRMKDADQTISALAKDGTTTSIPGSRSPYIGPAISAAQPGNWQQLDQAKRNFINAVLRRESGAVISDSEFKNAELQYFPQVGDSEAVIAQKARNRAQAADLIMAEVPENKRPSMRAPTAGGGLPSPSDIDAELARRLNGRTGTW